MAHNVSNASALGWGVTMGLTLDTLEAPEDVKDFIRSEKTGAGFWSWKPWAIEQLLNHPDVREGDLILYLDASSYIADEMVRLLPDRIIGLEFLVFAMSGNLNYQWTTHEGARYVFPEMYPDLESWCSSTLANDPQTMANIIGFVNTARARALIREWRLTMSPTNREAFDDSFGADQCVDFKESRRDQQMLSLLLDKHYPGLRSKLPDSIDARGLGLIFHKNINGQSRHL
jgi:hypothetical protein